jgi:hypothetical protein
VTLTGLVPQTRYLYKISTSSKALAGGDNEHYFVTSSKDSDEPTKVWILGDAGSSGRLDRGEDPAQAAARDGFLKRYPLRGIHFIMMLGDNAYDHGTDLQYQRGFFDPYRSVLRTKVSWPTQGNHDHSGQAYYKVYSLPSQGESGGVASTTEHYYSFDHGNAHFISLNSEVRDASFREAMIRWLRQDLAANQKPWTILFWHHPPYSKGHHDADDIKDSGGRMVWMREKILPIIEEAGVDLVFTGHSHSYERSKFIARYYGVAGDFSERVVIQPGDGDDRRGQAYTKDSLSRTPYSGTVYVTAGNAGAIQGGPLNHPVMEVSKLKLGSVLLEIDANEARTTMVGSDGSTEDTFTIRKEPARPRAVRNLTATVDGGVCQVALAWEGATSDQSYSIYRSSTPDARGDKVGTIQGGTPMFVDTDIASIPGAVWYSVRATNGRGFGPWGSAAFVSTLPPSCAARKSPQQKGSSSDDVSRVS